jgi:Trypsin
MKTMKPLHVLTTLFIASLIGCADQKPMGKTFTKTIDAKADIVGGTDSTYKSSEDSSVVFISTENSKNENVVCTGTFISNKLILTAAHCISGHGANSMSVTFRKKTYLKDQDLVDIPIKEVYRLDFKALHEEQIKKGDILFKDEGQFHDDLGIIEYGDGLPEQAKIAYFPKDNQFLVPEKKLLSMTALGYGRNNGVLYTDNPMTDNGEMVLRYKKLVTHSKEINPFANTFKIDQVKNKGGLCYGDSGGPAMIKDPVSKKNIIIGVASQVRNDRSGLTGSKMEVDYCKDESLYVSMYYYKKYLSAAIKKAIEGKEKLEQMDKLFLENQNKPD